MSRALLHSVAPSGVRVFSELIASCRHPAKGRILFARRALAAGETLAVCPMSEVISAYHPDMCAFEARLGAAADPAELLQHVCPAGDGRLCEQNVEHLNAFFSHAATPNIAQNVERFTAAELRLEALRDIAVGDELTVDYDESVGYERHAHEAHVAQFLELCAAHGVEKRPARLTLVTIRPPIPPLRRRTAAIPASLAALPYTPAARGTPAPQEMRTAGGPS